MMKNYYSILDVSQQASPIEIKKAFRGMAKKYHPDRNIEIDTTQKFREIYEAYDILYDKQKRIKYTILLNDFLATKKTSISFDEIIKQSEERSKNFSTISYSELELFLKVLFKKTPDILLTTLMFLIGSFLFFYSLFQGNSTAIIFGAIMGIPLITISIHDFSLIFQKKNTNSLTEQ